MLDTFRAPALNARSSAVIRTRRHALAVSRLKHQTPRPGPCLVFVYDLPSRLSFILQTLSPSHSRN